ncbi:mucin-3A, partial [Aplysia californica]|uniref:Mucin-3A n=1 Tax=Aplysia californica TaxID=6500 RepID=A0ABM1VTK8_APLCA
MSHPDREDLVFRADELWLGNNGTMGGIEGCFTLLFIGRNHEFQIGEAWTDADYNRTILPPGFDPELEPATPSTTTPAVTQTITTGAQTETFHGRFVYDTASSWQDEYLDRESVLFSMLRGTIEFIVQSGYPGQTPVITDVEPGTDTYTVFVDLTLPEPISVSDVNRALAVTSQPFPVPGLLEVTFVDDQPTSTTTPPPTTPPTTPLMESTYFDLVMTVSSGLPWDDLYLNASSAPFMALQHELQEKFRESFPGFGDVQTRLDDVRLADPPLTTPTPTPTPTPTDDAVVLEFQLEFPGDMFHEPLVRLTREAISGGVFGDWHVTQLSVSGTEVELEVSTTVPTTTPSTLTPPSSSTTTTLGTTGMTSPETTGIPPRVLRVSFKITEGFVWTEELRDSNSQPYRDLLDWVNQMLTNLFRAGNIIPVTALEASPGSVIVEFFMSPVVGSKADGLSTVLVAAQLRRADMGSVSVDPDSVTVLEITTTVPPTTTTATTTVPPTTTPTTTPPLSTTAATSATTTEFLDMNITTADNSNISTVVATTPSPSSPPPATTTAMMQAEVAVSMKVDKNWTEALTDRSSAEYLTFDRNLGDWLELAFQNDTSYQGYTINSLSPGSVNVDMTLTFDDPAVSTDDVAVSLTGASDQFAEGPVQDVIATTEVTNATTTATTTTATTTTAFTKAVEIDVHILSGLNYTLDYENPNSEMYQLVESSITDWVNNTFAGLPSFQSSRVISITEGSVLVRLQTIFTDTSMTSQEVLEALNGNLDNFLITDSVVELSDPNAVATATPTPLATTPVITSSSSNTTTPATTSTVTPTAATTISPPGSTPITIDNNTTSPESDVTDAFNVTTSPGSDVTDAFNVTTSPGSDVTDAFNVTTSPGTDVTDAFNVTSTPGSDGTRPSTTSGPPLSTVVTADNTTEAENATTAPTPAESTPPPTTTAAMTTATTMVSENSTDNATAATAATTTPTAEGSTSATASDLNTTMVTDVAPTTPENTTSDATAATTTDFDNYNATTITTTAATTTSAPENTTTVEVANTTDSSSSSNTTVVATTPSSSPTSATTAEADLKTLLVQLRIDREWEEEYGDTESQQYKDLQKAVIPWIDEAFAGVQGYRRSRILSVREGSVIVDVSSTFGNGQNFDFDEARAALMKALNNGFPLGNVTADVTDPAVTTVPTTILVSTTTAATTPATTATTATTESVTTEPPTSPETTPTSPETTPTTPETTPTSPSAETPEPTVTIEPKIVRGKIKIVSGYTWDESLADTDSAPYKALSQELTDLLNAFYRSKNYPGFREVKNLQFSEGSVIVVYDLVFEPTRQPDSAQLTQDLQQAVRANAESLGPYRLNVDDIRHQELSAENTDDDDIPEWAIAVIVCGGLLFIFIVFMFVVLCTRRSTNKKYKLDEDPEEAQYKRSWASGSHGNGSSPSLPDDMAAYDNTGFDQSGADNNTYHMRMTSSGGGAYQQQQQQQQKKKKKK